MKTKGFEAVHTLKIIASTTIMGASVFAAEAISFSDTCDSIAKLTANLGVLGVLVWYLRYVTSVDRPRVDSRHQAIIDKIGADHVEAARVSAEAHVEAVKALVSDFRLEFREQRAASKDALDHTLAQMEVQNQTVLAVIENCSDARHEG